ncbi:TusE/DsrC/DsvC family sulfur relay protein [Plebeiibacterium sediminum]|uniref:TusE/DsrC/DsvC family sulfur relay protein n=1 Tax=Plebeiibacterium sediminum TaxID=2992112 RepID=A0AAE3M3I5_9BACT|nr:TusE/DsrC/DsvC family sulfur relay protein [Plebeiobacterium sediminum]MCW3786140.1 TusE/DsrC/DsvC family sulfur relay protein [Plebeiobacterium sediminum]
MGQKVIANKTIDVNDEGYMTDPSQWDKDVASALAEEIGIELSDKHFEVLDYLREKFKEGEVLTIRKVGKSGIVDIKGLYQLFPGGPLKYSSKIAGIPKPASCV